MQKLKNPEQIPIMLAAGNRKAQAATADDHAHKTLAATMKSG
jgi:hypothetical protein